MHSSMKIDFSVLALTVFVIIPFLSIIEVLSVYESANAQVNIVPGTDEPANTTWNDKRVELSVPSIIKAGRFNATDIVQTNTLKLDSDVKNLVILIPDKRLIAQNFLPLDATIIEGTNVVWVNGDKVSPHRITLEADGKMPPVFSNKTIPYQNGTEYTFDTQGTYKVSDPLNTDTPAPTGTINVIAPQYAPDNISTNSTQDTVGLFVVPAEGKDFFDKHLEMLGYRVKDDYRIPGPEDNNVQL